LAYQVCDLIPVFFTPAKADCFIPCVPLELVSLSFQPVPSVILCCVGAVRLSAEINMEFWLSLVQFSGPFLLTHRCFARAAMAAEGGTLQAFARLSCVAVAWRSGLRGDQSPGHNPDPKPTV